MNALRKNFSKLLFIRKARPVSALAHLAVSCLADGKGELAAADGGGETWSDSAELESQLVADGGEKTGWAALSRKTPACLKGRISLENEDDGRKKAALCVMAAVKITWFR